MITIPKTPIWATPEPLGQRFDSVAQPYPVDAFPNFAATAIEAIAHHVQCPVPMAANCVLGALAFLAQDRVNAPARHQRDGMPCSLFILTQGESGSRKSQAQRLAENYIRQHEHTQYEKYREDKRAFDGGLRGLRGDDKASYLENHKCPVDPAQIFTDATLEAITGRFVDGWIKAVIWSTDEAGQFLHGATMKGDTAASALGTLTKLFDSGICERQRSKSNLNGSGRVYDTRLTFSLLGQHEVLVNALNDPIMRGQGFLPRFIAAFPSSMAGTRLQDNSFYQTSAYNDPRLIRYWFVFQSFYEDVNFSDSSVQRIPKRSVMPLSDEASIVLLDFYNEVERQQQAGGRYEHLRAFASRADELVRRIATIFAFVEDKKSIDADIVTNACRIVSHSLSEWRRYSEVEQAGETDAQKLLKWLLRQTSKDQRQIPTSTVQNRCNPKHIRKKEIFEVLLAELEATHYIRLFNIERTRYLELNPISFI